LKVSVFAAFFVYCFSTILGAVAMLPGGLGVTDGTIAGLLKLLSIESGTAAFATILIRVVTLWFAVIIGLIFLLLAEKRYDRKTETDTQKVPKGKIKFLFHLHTKASNDGWLDYQTIIDFCRQQKIKQLAVTDHNEIYGALEIKKLANGNPNVIIGEEIKTLEGEIIGLFLNRKIERGQMIGETIRQIREQGGIVCLPHPGDKIRRSAVSCETAEKIIHNIDIVEVFNGRNLFSSTDKFARGLAEKNNKAMIAGADAHLSTELGRVINIIGDFQSKSELVKSLKLTEYVDKKTNIFIQVWCLILKKLK